MKFGPVPASEAEGAVLAHSLRIDGGVLKKGSILTAADTKALAGAGYEAVTVARLEPGDLDENGAAAALAADAAGNDIDRSRAATGRVNLNAAALGLALIDGPRVDRLNRVSEALTIATVPPFALLGPGQMAATVKVIPFAVAEAVVSECAEIARDGGPLVRLARLMPKRVGLIQTLLPGIKDSTLAKTEEVTRARLEALGSRLLDSRRCPHDEGAVADALETLATEGCDIVLVLGASAITDRRDVVPAGIERCGGIIDHFGMPVDPGNLMLLARRGPIWVLGLPGSGRSPRTHGFDWVLQRLLADLPVTGADLMAMGVGGLLKDIPGRPLPRIEATRAARRAARSKAGPKIAALVLAAGQSRRMGAVNKLLAEIDGVPMVVRVVDAVLQTRAAPVIVVTGHESDRVRAALDRPALEFVHNQDYEIGLSTSLKTGIGALPSDVQGVLVCLGDMPRVTSHHIERIAQAFAADPENAICVPTFNGKRGNPVLWARRYLTEMDELAGDVGARHLIGTHSDAVVDVELSDDGVLIDVDSPQALTDLETDKIRNSK